MASKGIGRLLQFGIAKETTRGTPNASADFWIPFAELDFNEKWENVIDEQSRGVIEDSAGATRAKIWAEGTLKAPIEDKTFPLIMYATLGAISSSGPTDSTYTHTITVAQSSQHQALSLYIDDPLSGQDYKHGLGSVDKLEIAYEQSAFVNFTLSLKSKQGATTTNTTAVSSQNRYLPQHFTFTVASTYGTLSTGTAIVLKSMKLTIDPQLEADEVLGSTSPADFLNKSFSIEGTLEALWQNESDFKTAALANTTKAVRIDLTSDVTLGASSHPQFQINLAKVTFKELTRPLILKDLVKQTVAFKAHYSTTDSLMISVTAKNAQASY